VIPGNLLGRDSLACTAALGDVKHGYQPVLKGGRDLHVLKLTP